MFLVAVGTLVSSTAIMVKRYVALATPDAGRILSALMCRVTVALTVETPDNLLASFWFETDCEFV